MSAIHLHRTNFPRWQASSTNTEGRVLRHVNVPPLSVPFDSCDRSGLDDTSALMLLRKEVIQPHLPVRLPCYDFVPITSPTFDSSFHKG